MLLAALALAFAEDAASCAPGAEGCTAPPPVGALPKSVIDSVVKANMRAYRTCYQRGLDLDPTLAGLVAVKFVIAKNGTVSSATTKRTTLEAPTVESCVNAAFMKLVFPPPQGGGIIIVTYPFVFTPYLTPGRAVVAGRRLRQRGVTKALRPVRKAAMACSAATADRSVRFVVTEEGAIAELRLIGAPTPTDAEEACVAEAFASVHFSPPGARTRVYYSLANP